MKQEKQMSDDEIGLLLLMEVVRAKLVSTCEVGYSNHFWTAALMCVSKHQDGGDLPLIGLCVFMRMSFSTRLRRICSCWSSKV